MELGRILSRALSNTGISVLYQDLSLRFKWAQNVPAAWSGGDVLGKTEAEILPERAAQPLIAARGAALGGDPQNFEMRVDGDGIINWYDVWVDADVSDDGHVVGIVTTVVDITEQKQREETLRTLLREVSHRSKNLLAIIQSIATQTGRHARSVDSFLLRFRGRIQSLAASQDLVTSSNWRGADLRELIASQVSRYTGDPRAVALTGENPYLSPNAALHIGLALHELAVNSVSFGALSSVEGRVVIDAKLENRAQDRRGLALTWSERIKIAPGPALEKRFGSAALERIVPASLNGDASLQLTGEMLVYTLFVPDGNFD